MQTQLAHASATDLAERILALLGRATGAGDLAPDAVERALGIPIEHDADDPARYGFVRAVEGGWLCRVRSLPASEGDRLRTRLSFAFEDTSGTYTDLTPVCALDFEAFARTLAATGYAGEVRTGMRDAFEGFAFVRAPIEVDVQVRSLSAAEPTRLCVNRLIVSAQEALHV